MCAKKGKANWEELLAGMVGASVSWFPRWKEGGARVLCSCEGFPNIPLIGTRGCINYNPILAIRQLGYPMRGVLSEEIIAPFVSQGFSEGNANMLPKIQKAWNVVERKDKELKGSNNGVIGGYHKWLKAWTQGITWLLKLKNSSGEETEVPEESEEVQGLKVELEKTRMVKEKLKMTATRVRKECDKLRDVNMTTAEVLEREAKSARKEEWGRNKF